MKTPNNKTNNKTTTTMEQNKQQEIKAFIEKMHTQGFTNEEIMDFLTDNDQQGEESKADRLHDSSIDIRERILTFDDAVAYLGEDNPFVKVLNQSDSLPTDMVAYAKLRIIAAALNEEPDGWLPKCGNNGDCRWTPWFSVVALGGRAYDGTYAGLGYVSTYDGFAATNAGCGSRLCYKSEELAEYSGIQFKAIWEDFILR